MAALSFCYAPPLSGQYAQHFTEDEESIVAQLQDTCQNVMTSTGCQISVLTTKSKNPQLSHHTDYNLSLTGSAQALMDARGDLLRNCPLEVRIRISRSFSLFTNPFLSTFLSMLDQIDPPDSTHSPTINNV